MQTGTDTDIDAPTEPANGPGAQPATTGGAGRPAAEEPAAAVGRDGAGGGGDARGGGPDGARAELAAARARRGAELDRWLAELLAETGAGDEVALVTVGSHGRGELTPGGDLDLVLVHRGRPDIAEIADRLWYPIWDRGLRLDHSVRTLEEARQVAGSDLKAAMGLLGARRLAGDQELADQLRTAVLADWRLQARRRLAELAELTRRRWADQGELAFLLEPDLKEARGGLRDVHVMQAAAATWAAPGPGERVRAAHDLLLDVRHALHETTGRATDRLVLQEHEAVARALGLADGTALLRAIVEAARTVTYAADHLWRHVDRYCADRSRSVRAAGAVRIERRPVGDGAVEHDGEVVLARGADLTDPVLPLRVASAAAQAGLPLAPATVERLADKVPPLPVPWPAEARDALVSLLGAGAPAITVWEALDQAGLIVRALPEWERVRNRPQRNPVHRFTVDRHLVEAAAGAAAMTRDVARPDLLLVGALLHDIGKGLPGDHSRTGAVLAREMAVRMGFADGDADVLETVVRHHLLLPDTATRRDLDDPVTVQTVLDGVCAVPGRGREVLEILAALAVADAQATGPAAWGAWKARLVEELVRRVDARLTGTTPPREDLHPAPGDLALARHDGASVRVVGSRVTVAVRDRPGLLWRAAGVLALHRLVVRTARVFSAADVGTAVLDFVAVPEYGTPPEPAALEADLRRMLAGRLDVAARLEQRAAAVRRRPGVPVPPPRVTIVDDASSTATVVEVRAHDRPGLLWRIGQAIGACGLQVVGARVDTLGAEAVDVFYVVDGEGRPLETPAALSSLREKILAALR
ncbi:UTP--GlnB (protein PII) uridylyltransferase, GlnD [Thermomonospora echinospora]|uniref:Bifunctional uridylyltransferase/uridylyl-removing enzyme n=2 Tax=Thermomonospora echinospora TaxID=1992 RepID=A0A1H6DP43_9ACTN|nr:UTP--GlnB (protein PII) uridylyltransferase, GlnD [Thermomonospora echinospora]